MVMGTRPSVCIRLTGGFCAEEVQAFEDKWLAWVRAGAPRDRDGKPILPQTKVRAA